MGRAFSHEAFMLEVYAPMRSWSEAHRDADPYKPGAQTSERDDAVRRMEICQASIDVLVLRRANQIEKERRRA
jgi:hypothetical protein